MLLLMCAAAAVLMITMGMRQSLGLYIAPIIESTHVGYAAMSFALAVGQLMWGVAQPVFGALADRHGSRPRAHRRRACCWPAARRSRRSPATNSRCSPPSACSPRPVPARAASRCSSAWWRNACRPRKRSFASGFVNAGGSLGQFVFAPLNQLLIASFGWMVRHVEHGGGGAGHHSAGRAAARASASRDSRDAPRVAAPSALTLREQLAIAARDKSYWCLHAGFFTCGFHIAFLVTHLPGEVKLCSLPASVAASSLAIIGLANVAGSLTPAGPAA